MLLSLPPLLLLLFFFSLLYDNVPWQWPWRHARPNEPPCSASFSRIAFGIERESWGVGLRASGVLARRKRRRDQLNEISGRGLDVTESTASVCWLCEAVCVSTTGTVAGGEMDPSQSSGIGCLGRRWCHLILETLVDFFLDPCVKVREHLHLKRWFFRRSSPLFRARFILLIHLILCEKLKCVVRKDYLCKHLTLVNVEKLHFREYLHQTQK